MGASSWAHALYGSLFLALVACGGGGGGNAGGGGSNTPEARADEVIPPGEGSSPPAAVGTGEDAAGGEMGIGGEEEPSRYTGDRDRWMDNGRRVPESVSRLESSEPVERRDDILDTESWHRAVINADDAENREEWGERIPGEGVIVAVMDNPVHSSLSWLDEADIRQEVIDFELGDRPYTEGVNEHIGDANHEHGMRVTALIARPNGGIAPGATVLSYPTIFPEDIASELPGAHSIQEEGQDGIDSIVEAIENIIEGKGGERPDFVNMSWGTGFEQTLNLDDLVSAMEQDRDNPNRAVFVWAAGNSGSPGKTPGEAEDTARLQAENEGLRGNVVTVISLRQGGYGERELEIAVSSAGCQGVSEWCIAAPGDELTVEREEDENGDGELEETPFSGTSAAAPVVTGGLAFIKSWFRGQISNEETVIRMFETADKTGHYPGPDGTYVDTDWGQGVLDLYAATEPLGITTIPGGRGVTDGIDPVEKTRFGSSRNYGDAVHRALAGRELAAFDSLGAPFWYDASSFVTNSAREPLSSRLARFMREGKPEPASALPGRPLALTEGKSISTHAIVAGDRPVGARLETSGLRFGLSSESGTLLGASASGAFGRTAGEGVYAGYATEHTAGAWEMRGALELGFIAPRWTGTLVEGAENVRTSALTLSAKRETGWGSLELGLRQPPRIESGEVTFNIPVGRTYDRKVLRERFSASLEPSGRQRDLSLEATKAVGAGALSLGVVHTLEPGHIKRARSEWAAFAGAKLRW